MAELEPDRPAIVLQRCSGAAAQYQARTFRQLSEDSKRLAAGMRDAGFTPGMRVAIFVKPGFEFFTLIFALFEIGALPVLIDPGIGLRNLKHCLAQARPRAFIGAPLAQALRALLGWGRGSVETIVTVGPRGLWGGLSYAALIETPPRKFDHEPDPEAPAAILFTSGSTGPPKGAVYTQRIFLEQLRLLRETYAIEPGEKDVATFPLFALFGPALGMTSILPQMNFSKPGSAPPQRIAAAIQDQQAGSLFGSPAVIRNLAAWGQQTGSRLPSLRRVISAGAPAEPAVLAEFCRMLNPGVEVFTPYGSTEALPVTNVGSREVLATAEQTAAGAGICVGRPLSGVEVRIIRVRDEPLPAWSDELILPVNEIGEITVSGPAVTREYFERADATHATKIADVQSGRFYHRMGDAGYFDEQGRLWFCGRLSQRVITDEGALFTIPCERVFNAHPQVRRTALVGIACRASSPRARGEASNASAQRGKLPVLCVELKPEAARADRPKIIRELHDLGGRHEHTRAIRHFLFHPKFPVDARHNSKIFREKLARWAARKLSKFAN